MRDPMWVVGTRHTNGALIQVNGAVLSTGSATVTYRRSGAGTDEYLQADATTWSTTPHAFAAVFEAGVGFVHELVVPVSALGFAVSFYVDHSVLGRVYSEDNEVGASIVGTGLAGQLVP